MDSRPPYFRIFLAFLRNSLVRDMTFRANFLLDAISSTLWIFMNLGFYVLIFHYSPMIGAGTGWGRYEFFLFLATALLVNNLVRGLFLVNAVEFSEQIRTGGLDFALVKPIDTQFLVSLGRVEWAAAGPILCALGLMGYSFWRLDYLPGPLESALYVFYVLSGVAIYYSLMIVMAATSIWLGRNKSLLDFWIYITNFSRYPMEIYQGPIGAPLRWAFTFFVPVLVAVNVPARLLVRPLRLGEPADLVWPAYALLATIASLAICRFAFTRSLASYRSASS